MSVNKFTPIEERKRIFLEKLNKINKFELIGEYKKEKCQFKCLMCGNVFFGRLDHILRRKSCPNCSKNIRSTSSSTSKEKFLENVKKFGKANDIIIVGKYVNLTTKANFKCLKCGTEFYTIPRNLYSRKCCPTCWKEKRYTRYNTLEPINSTNLEMSCLLKNEENGNKYCYGSNVKLEWICPDCKSVVIDSPKNVHKRGGLACKFCNDGMSYPNKFIGNLLKQADITFIPEKTFTWSKKENRHYYYYDFYLPVHNTIIEVMGGQHYDKSGFYNSLENIKYNDCKKKSLAMKNDISNYIILDCRESNLEFIKKSIFKSWISKIIEHKLINWNYIDFMSRKSILKMCCKEYEENKKCLPKDLAKLFNINSNTASRYLKAGSKLGLCSYSPEECNFRRYRARDISVNQYSLEGSFLNSYNSYIEASEKTKIHKRSISLCAAGDIYSAGGFIWIKCGEENSLEDRIRFIKNKISGSSRSVVQLDECGNVIRTFNSTKEAKIAIGSSNISKC